MILAPNNGSTKKAVILLIEDNQADIELISKSINENNLGSELIIMCDAEKALDYLYKRNNYADAARPDLILLDLGLTRMDGLEFLKKIKQDPDIKLIPLIVLSTSNDEGDISYSYSNLANCFITKPIDLSRFIEVIQAAETFWLKIAKIPAH
jgi:two-component system, chemotaxis family, response regulator Rcp1